MKDHNYRSSVDSIILRDNDASRTVTFENVFFITIRNLGPNDATIVMDSGRNIIVPTGNLPAIELYFPTEFPLTESWKAEFPAGDTDLQILYTYRPLINELV
jgi:hypothetical protein